MEHLQVAMLSFTTCALPVSCSAAVLARSHSQQACPRLGPAPALAQLSRIKNVSGNVQATLHSRLSYEVTCNQHGAGALADPSAYSERSLKGQSVAAVDPPNLWI